MKYFQNAYMIQVPHTNHFKSINSILWRDSKV